MFAHIFRDILDILSLSPPSSTTSSKPTQTSKRTRQTKKSKAAKQPKSTKANTATPEYLLPDTNLLSTMPESIWFSSKLDINLCPKYKEWWNPLQSTDKPCPRYSKSPKPDKETKSAKLPKKPKATKNANEIYERKLMDLSTPYLTYVTPSKPPKTSLLFKVVRSSKTVEHNKTINEKREDFLKQIEYIGKTSKPIASPTSHTMR